MSGSGGFVVSLKLSNAGRGQTPDPADTKASVVLPAPLSLVFQHGAFFIMGWPKLAVPRDSVGPLPSFHLSADCPGGEQSLPSVFLGSIGAPQGLLPLLQALGTPTTSFGIHVQPDN